MYKAHVLVVDDNAPIRKFVRANLNARNFEVSIATNGIEAISITKNEKLDLIILDIIMPGMDGFEVCRQIREWSNVPIIMLSAKDEESDKIRCLEVGADDYITKPFSLNELLQRIQAVLRRAQRVGGSPPQSGFSNGDLEIDYDKHCVFIKGQEVDLTDVEYKILTYLAQNAGRVITPQHILEKVWGQGYIDKPERLRVNISRLRKKLHTPVRNTEYIFTQPGLGYLIKAKVKL